MLAIYNELPKFCPACGEPQKWGEFDRQDFFAGASMTCKCGLHYAYLEGPKLLAAASEGGDIGRYLKPEDLTV